MLICYGDYSIVYWKDRNMITIYLPQTPETANNTISPVSDRRVDLSDYELKELLFMVYDMFRKEGK